MARAGALFRWMHLACAALCGLACAASLALPQATKQTPAKQPAKQPAETQPAEKQPAEKAEPEKTPAPPTAVDEPPETPLEAIQARVDQLEADTQLPADQKKSLLEAYREVLVRRREAQQFAKQTSAFQEAVRRLPEQLEEVRAPEPTLPPAAVGPDVPQADLEKSLKQAEADRTAAQETLAQLEGRPQQQAARRTEIQTKLQPAARARGEQADRQLRDPPPPNETAEGAIARRTLAAARKKAAETELASYTAELASLDAGAQLAPLARDRAARRLAQLEELVTTLREAANERRLSEADRELARVKRAVAGFAQGPAQLKRLAEANLKLVEQRVGPESLTSRTAALAEELDRTLRETQQLEGRYKSIAEKAAIPGLDDVLGALLQQEWSSLPDLLARQRAIAARQKLLGVAELERIQLEESRGELADLDAQVRRKLAPLAPGNAEFDGLRFQAQALLEKQRTYLDQLLADSKSYVAEGVELNVAEQELIVVARKYRSFIAERILWIRSSAPISPGEVARTGEASLWLFGYERWHEVGQRLWADLVSEPAMAFGGLALWGLAWLVHRRFRRSIHDIGAAASKSRTDSIWPTFEVLAMTVAISALWPLALWLVAWRLTAAPFASEGVQAIASGLHEAGLVLFTIELFRNICRAGGLGEAHFGWDVARLQSIRRGLRWLVFILAPLTFIVSALEVQSLDARRDSLGRMAMIAAMAALAVFCWQTLRPAPRDDDAESSAPIPWAERLRWITCWLAVATPLFMAGIAAWGYYYTAVQLSSRLIQSVWFLQVLGVAHAVLLRWLLVARRRMALDHARKRRAAQAAAPAGAPAVTPEMEMSLATVGEQAKRMLGIVVSLAGIVGLWLVWVDVLPALAVFQRVVLWTDGDTVVTLADLGLGVCILLLTFAASSNGPGLLEILLFNRLPLDPGARYAATAVARYLITAAGIIGGASVIGFRWSQVQWLVAAVTVGLGFGLQEIFANFVSGLIILFERPIRVGDVVTVGNVSGRVARIRIRATTIVDWDRKELIVPNKEFVTGQVLNWTLTDSVLRIVLKVGTAYGTDPQRVVDTLLQVARDLPKVLRDPAPSALFLGFGDSALMFELRVFVAGLDAYGEVQHALHVQTERALRAAGVEIPFPQRDLHIRTQPAAGATLPGATAPENGSPAAKPASSSQST